ESSVGSVLQLLTQAPARFEAGASRIGETNTTISTFMLLVAAFISAWSVWHAGRTGRLGAGWLTSVSAGLLCSRLFSLQFVSWLIPGAGISWSEGDRRLGIWTAAAVVISGIFWRFYPSIEEGHRLAVTVVVLRNVVIAGLAVTGVTVLATAPARLPSRTSS